MIRLYGSPRLSAPSLVVGWAEDSGSLGTAVVDYLIQQMDGVAFADVLPEAFFPLGGVSVQHNCAVFPEAKLYWCRKADLLLLRSSVPTSEWYLFLSSVLEVAVRECHLQDVYTVGGMVTWSAHTSPRHLLAMANGAPMKRVLVEHGLEVSSNFETPAGQRPTLSSFLLWVAARKGLPAAALWVPVPFYLISTADPQAWRKPLEFLRRRFALDLPFTDLDQRIAEHWAKLSEARALLPSVDEAIRKLESDETLTEEEGEALVKGIEAFFQD